MSLGRRIAFKVIGLLLGLVLMSAATLWGLRGLHRSAVLAHREYRCLRVILDAVRQAVDEPDHRLSETQGGVPALGHALAWGADCSELWGLEPSATEAGTEARPSHAELARLLVELRGALESLHGAAGDDSAEVAAVRRVMQQLNALAGHLDGRMAAARNEAEVRLRLTIAVIGSLSVILLAVTTWLNLSFYRGIVTPLRRLREGVSHIARGNLQDRLGAGGAVEFQALGRDFNRMAEELEGLYRGLEEKVEAKSRALVRSERLASVGFLAAGVAHEINNPLNIISGYAELMLRRLRGGGEGPAAPDVETALQTICDEAFRCKGITDKLLSLSRSGEGARERVSVSKVVVEVASMATFVKQYRDRRVSVHVDPGEELPVLGNASELKQVLLNLTLNALQAVEPGVGEVVIEGVRRDGVVQLRVIDNGRGMTPAILEHVFEPFFTDRRGSGGQGVGLGLSISHAIVQSHGGRIAAASAGPGKGSCFTVELPLCGEVAANGRTDE